MSNAVKNDYGTKQQGTGPRTGSGEEKHGGVMGKVTDKAQEFATGMSEMAGQAKEKVQEWASYAGDQIGSGYDSFVGVIRRNPVPALLIGIGIGFLCGSVFCLSARQRFPRYEG
jgi:hypothetical protein